MTYIKVAQSGYDAGSDPVEDMLIDSNYQTMLIASQGNGSVNVPSSGTFYIDVGTSLGFVPFVCFFTTNGFNKTALPNNAYAYQPPIPVVGFSIGLIPGDPWQYYYQTTGYTADYMYYVYYLPAQGSTSTSTDTPPNTPPYVNVGNIFNPATTSAFENLSFSSQTQSLQILSEQTFNAAATVGANNTYTFTFPHGLGEACPYYAILQNYFPANGSYQGTYNIETCILYNDDTFGVDATNFYYIYNNSSSSNVSVNIDITVYFFIPPS